jgi:hypothetical protein
MSPLAALNQTEPARSCPMLISSDNHVWPPWAPDWLRDQVESPDCSRGTHTRLRHLAKWLTIFFAEHPEAPARWLYHAAQRCARDVDKAEVDRLLCWAEARFGTGNTHGRTPSMNQRTSASSTAPSTADLEEIFSIAEQGPRLAEYRETSPLRLSSLGARHTECILRQWSNNAQEDDPWICFGSTSRFWTRRLSTCRRILSAHEQIVPSPMLARSGRTADGHLSEHSLAGTGERLFLIVEFDFAHLTPRGEPTIWVPLLDRCEAAGITVLDLNAALIAHLGKERPLWMTVYSGGKSLQAWFPCRGEPEEELQRWFNDKARTIGACHSTWCKSQFVRMPDGTRAQNNARQLIEFFNPEVL